MGCRHVAVLVVLVGCTGCLIADSPDGDWRALTNDCVALDREPGPILRNEEYLHAFTVAGDTIVSDEPDGLAQLRLREGERSLIVRTTSDDQASFQAMENDLVYYAPGEAGRRDLVADRGFDESPRWLIIASFSIDDFTIVHANRAGVYMRTDSVGKWRRWDRATQKIVSTDVPDDAVLTTDGTHLFYSDGDDIFSPTRNLYNLPVEGGTPTIVGEIDDFTEPVGIADSRMFVWHQDLPNYFDEVTPAGLRTVTEIPILPVPARRAFGGGYFYWVPIVEGPDSIRRVPLDGGPQERVATISGGDFGVMQADACNVYWQVVGESGVELWAMSH